MGTVSPGNTHRYHIFLQRGQDVYFSVLTNCRRFFYLSIATAQALYSAVNVTGSYTALVSQLAHASLK